MEDRRTQIAFDEQDLDSSPEKEGDEQSDGGARDSNRRVQGKKQIGMLKA